MMTIPPAGVKGFDCNRVLTLTTARTFAQAGYRHVVRYVPRVTAGAGDLTAEERDTIHQAGLALMPVQHVKSAESWECAPDLGTQYGRVAAAAAAACHVAPGTTLWCDLEGMALNVPVPDVRGFANNWFTQVAGAGYQPGLYVGWHCGLSPQQLYNLKFTRYWSAYNLDADQRPVIRGVCMTQHAAKPSDLPPGLSWAKEEFDVDVITVDALGGLPCVDAPDEWQPII